MEDRFNAILRILSDSIINIADDYFNFQVAGLDDAVKRERVYCSELYHRLRERDGEIPYIINSEPNKNKHPIIEEYCGAIDPDLIVHRPGEMSDDSNLAVIEVKRSSGDLVGGINKDLETINCMTSIPNGYYGGIIVVFGEISDLRKRNLKRRIRNLKCKEMRRLVLILHEEVNSVPDMIEI